MTSHSDLYQRLGPTFRAHAIFRVQRWRSRINADEFESRMWEVLLVQGVNIVHKCGPLMDQKPAYIATWAARRVIKHLGCERHHEILSESITYDPEPTRLTKFAKYVEKIGQEWGIDIGDAVDIIASGEVSPEFEEYIRALGPRDARVAALLLSGLRPYHIYKKDEMGESFESERATKKVCKQLIQILKKAA